MLKELVAYYDCVTNQPNSDFVPDGYSKVSNVAYKIVLTKDGKLKDILPNTFVENNGQKPKEKGYDEILPFRYSVSGISAETIECREKYIFGLEWDKANEKFITSKSSLSAFEKNKQKNGEFLKDLSSDVAVAYRLFLENWLPEQELENPLLLSLGKAYETAKFIIVADGNESRKAALHNDIAIKEKWDTFWKTRFDSADEDVVMAQCSVSGEYAPVARIHNNLTGITGGLATGVNLVCFKTSAFWSYGKEQSYNSSVSTAVMEKYTKVFNYLSSSQEHKKILDDMTLLFWANTREKETPYLEDFLYELWDTDERLKSTFKQLGDGLNTSKEQKIDENVEFCILGVKPNTSRLAIKIFEKDSFGNIMARMEKHQEDMRISENDKQIAIWQITNELKSPKSKEDTVPPDLSAKLLTAILKNRPYPEYLLQTVVRRAKTDKDDEKTNFRAVNSRRARIIKAHLIRSGYYKGDEYMIDSKNQTDAFRCGRLFAVLEMIQKEALGDINATVKDKFFASACSTPNLVFARLIKLAQPHLKKIENDNKKYLAIYFDKMLQDLLGEMDSFPKTLSLQQQGDFILGYYQQKYTKKKNYEGEE